MIRIDALVEYDHKPFKIQGAIFAQHPVVQIHAVDNYKSVGPDLAGLLDEDVEMELVSQAIETVAEGAR